MIYTKNDLPKHPTTIRLDQKLHKAVSQKAEKVGLTFTGVVHLLLLAYTEGEVEVGVHQYPKKYLDKLAKESAELSRQYKEGKVKGYASAKEMFKDILGE